MCSCQASPRWIFMVVLHTSPVFWGSCKGQDHTAPKSRAWIQTQSVKPESSLPKPYAAQLSEARKDYNARRCEAGPPFPVNSGISQRPRRKLRRDVGEKGEAGSCGVSWELRERRSPEKALWENMLGRKMRKKLTRQHGMLGHRRRESRLRRTPETPGGLASFTRAAAQSSGRDSSAPFLFRVGDSVLHYLLSVR